MSAPTMAQVRAAMDAMINKAMETPRRAGGHGHRRQRRQPAWPTSPWTTCASSAAATPCARPTHRLDGLDSGENAQRLHSQGRNIADQGDPMMTYGTGGVVIMKDGVILGGIASGGYPSGQSDEDLSRIGLEAMNL